MDTDTSKTNASSAAPAKGASDLALQTVRMTTDREGIVTILLDAPGKSVNTLTPLMLSELGKVIARFEAHAPAAVIFASPKPRSFIAGADLFEIKKMTPDQVAKYLS